MDKKTDYSSITHVIIETINKIYKYSSLGYKVIPILLIVTSIIFVFLYTYHSLYRIDRNLFLSNKEAKYAFDNKRNIPKIVFYIMSIIIIIGLFYTYFKIKNMERGDLFTTPLGIYFLVLCPIVFILAVVGFFIYQNKIITFADSKDMKNGILACAIIIYICLFNMYI
jgi:phosphoglycerol transferase MdoB-like AlkP superfamily enzyme